MSDKPTEPCCGNCRFGSLAMNGYGRIECRRHAPSITNIPPVGGSAKPLWPEMYKHDWCGDHEPRAEPTSER